MCLVFDEILAYVVWRSGTGAFTANLNINLRKMVPLGSTQYFRSHITKRDGRKISVAASILDPADKTTKYAEATGLWIESSYMAKGTQKVDAAGKATSSGANTQKIDSKL